MPKSLLRALAIAVLATGALVAAPTIAPTPSVALVLALAVGAIQAVLVRTWLAAGEKESADAVMQAKTEAQRVQRESASTKQALEEIKDKLVKSSTTMASLAAIAKVTGQSLDIDKVLGSIMETVGSIGATRASIWLLGDDGRLKLASHLGWSDAEAEGAVLAMGDGIIGWVAQHGRAVDKAEVRRDPNLMDVEKKSKHDSVLAVPLVNNQETQGVLNIGAVDRKRIKGDSLDEEKRIIHFLGGLAAMSIKNAKVFGQTKEFAEKDVMTGLYNHRYYQDTMDREMKRSDRYGDPLSILLTDIDKFKVFNDTYGHQIGDLVLTKTAHLMAELARDSDIPCRYGGEEFVLILPSTSKQGAAMVAERLRKSIEGTSYETEKGTLKVTMSIGVATFPEDSRKKDELVRLCDEALYRAKEGGRNRVELALPAGAEAEAAPAPAPQPASAPPASAAPAGAPSHPILASNDTQQLARAHQMAVQRAKQMAAAGNQQGAREAAALAKAIASKHTQAMAAVRMDDPNLAAKAKAAARIAAARRQGGGQDAAARAAKARETANQAMIPPDGGQGS